MASYTMQLREYIEMFTQYQTLSIRQQIEEGRKHLFDFEYPFFDSTYKPIFETHFIRNFYMREIGFETEGLFKFQLENWLLVNMGYFNKLFESELLVFNPLENSKLEVSQKKTIDREQSQNTQTDGTSNSQSNANQKATQFDRQLESETPDSRLKITTQDGAGVIEYASRIDEATKNNQSDTTGESNDSTHVTGTSNANITGIEDYVESRIGKSGDQTYSKMLSEYRETLLRIEKKIFNEMNELFMLVY
jgi:hypothetical protein